MEKEYTNRGFRIFGHIPYRNGGAVRVQESSLAFKGPHIWLFIEGKTCEDHMGEHMMPTPQMNLEQAKELVEALNLFIQEAESNNLMEAPAFRRG